MRGSGGTELFAVCRPEALCPSQHSVIFCPSMLSVSIAHYLDLQS